MSSGKGTLGLPGFSEDGEWPFAPGVIKGYRQWQLNLGFQDSITNGMRGMHGHSWTTGWQEAECHVTRLSRPGGDLVKVKRHDKTPPVEACGCGFWAYHELDGRSVHDAALTVRVTPTGRMQVTFLVTGVIEGAGRVIIGSKGFRSQKARITAFLSPDFWNMRTGHVPGYRHWCLICSMHEDGMKNAAPEDLQEQAAAALAAFGLPMVSTVEELRAYGPEGQPPAL